MRKPRILIFDLETAPVEGKTWGKWDQNVLEMDHHGHILMVGYRWLGEETHVVDLRDFPRNYRRNRKDDSRLAGLLAVLFEEADVLVAHNGRQFDVKWAHARMAAHGITAPAPVPVVDTVRVLRKEFRLPSNSLNDAAGYFGLGAKFTHTGWHMWSEVLRGNDEAWDVMSQYCAIDVELLEKVYLFLRDGGWIRNHPNLARLTDRPGVCPHCAASGDNLVIRGYYRTKTMKYTQYRCSACGSYSRGTVGTKGDKPVHVATG